MTAKEIILCLSLKYKGNWDKIYNDIKNKVTVSQEELDEYLSSYSDNYITILDDNYPEKLKHGSYKPPFVIFYKGDIKLLNTKICSIITSKYTSQEDLLIGKKIIRDNPDIVFMNLGRNQCETELLHAADRAILLNNNNVLSNLQISTRPDFAPAGDPYEALRIISFLSTQLVILKSHQLEPYYLYLTDTVEVLALPHPFEEDLGNSLILQGVTPLLKSSQLSAK